MNGMEGGMEERGQYGSFVCFLGFWGSLMYSIPPEKVILRAWTLFSLNLWDALCF